ncbi:hypothetical protein [Aeromonas hydrophila]|uniref:hypothetical protein n=1 Tax=Aeromonas hydrophila TaxID=644 RepID=UPI002B4A136C|nr:hypothetical protein [Aeromonas hydrophila]
MNVFKGRGRVIGARAIGAAIVIFCFGLAFGMLTIPYWFVGVFTLTNAIMLLEDGVRYKTGKSFIGLIIAKLDKKA